MAVFFVVTEHPSFLTPDKERHYERIRGRLEGAAGARVESLSYLELGSAFAADAIVLSGSFAPWALHDQPALDRLGAAVCGFEGPVLGICAGMQLQVMFAGGAVGHGEKGLQKGYRAIDVLDDSDLLRGLPAEATVYQHHGDEVTNLPRDFRVLATSSECAVEAVAAPGRRWWGTQFHPEEFEPAHPAGRRVLRNFFELALSRSV